MARILVIGGHGKVALLTEPLLVEAGHDVVAAVRNPDHEADVRETGATPVVVDVAAQDTPALTDLVAGYDVVVWAAGARGGDPARTYAVDRDAAIRTIDAAVAAGVPRFVMVSYFGAGPDHGVGPDDGFFAYADAKSAADAHLAATDLAWTILRPSGLTDASLGGLETGEGVTASKVPRATVAALVAAVVDSPRPGHGVVAFNGGDRPIQEVVPG